MSFWDIVWFIIISFAFIAYLMVLFAIISDLFRDRETSGVVKAIWIVLLIVLPLVTSLVYLIARGGSMAQRQAVAVKGAMEQQDAYIKSVAGSGASPAEQIKHAKDLLDSGAVTQTEFDVLKAKALA
jgi:hypothetical protein